MSLADYADFDLEITRLAKGKYLARVVHSPGRESLG